MSAIFITDLHGHFDALEKLPPTNLLILGGDLTNFGTPQEFEAVVRMLRQRFTYVIGVAGNLDPGPAADGILADFGMYVGLLIQNMNGYNLIGDSGSNKCPRPTPYEWDDEERCKHLDCLGLPQVDILVTHAPPYGFGADVIANGAHVGSKYVARLAEMTTPKVHCCGHIHEAAGIYDENGTVLVNPGPFGDEGNYAEITLPIDGSRPIVTLKKANN